MKLYKKNILVVVVERKQTDRGDRDRLSEGIKVKAIGRQKMKEKKYSKQ